MRQDQAKQFMNIVLQFIHSNASEVDNIVEFEGLNLSNYPNPFNPVTAIKFILPKEEFAEIKIFNIKGQVIKSFPRMLYNAGINTVNWDSGKENDRRITSGVYFYQVRTESGLSQTKKMVLLK